ncbi:SSrecog-domain-containing protein [Coprinellus micaceus]|uniref:FACT complex subunit POB3 n=1 Tax=Coprinellus micaceus TaxID=71717 RepID=A0A4Y7SFL7_COPMI|nr:SSrecog-domain-containing protein [Coprinellus micaceus]
MTTQFDKIYHGLSPEVGKFRVASSGMGWKGIDSGNVVTLEASKVKWAQWIRVARNFQLRIGLSDHTKERFDGFLREEHDKIAQLLKNHFGITLETQEAAFKGWNWGVADFRGQDLAFLVSDRTAFELPLDNVANSNIAGRTEVSLEFANLAGSSKGKLAGDEMVEIRFHVPGAASKAKDSDAGSQKSDNENEEEEISAAQAFHETIKDRANIGQITGNMILSFEEVLVLTPRGRYDMDMFPEFLRLRGKTYDYKILFSSINRLFLLPKDDQHVLFILGLSTPIRQGQTRYQYLVMQFTREEEITAELNMTEEDLEKYDKLKKNYEDPTYEVVSSVFRALSRKKIIGAGSFQSRDGHPGIKANLKAVQGDLFMLEKYIFFVSKQPTLIEIQDIHQVVFSRVGASMGAAAARTFDLKIIPKNGADLNFSSINKEEHEVTEAYLKDKKVRVKNEMVPDADLLLADAGMDDDDDDEDMASIDSDDGPRRAPRAPGDDDESEEDEDFQASDSDSGSPTDTDSDDSGAQTASDASGDLALTTGTKKKTKKATTKGKAKAGADGDAAPKKKKAASKKDSNGSDAEDSDGEAKPKPKLKKKAAAGKAKAKDDEEMDIDVDGDEDDKPKPKPKPKPKSKAKKDAGDAMDVDEVKPKPKPKPKAKKPADSEVERPKKKLKTTD